MRSGGFRELLSFFVFAVIALSGPAFGATVYVDSQIGLAPCAAYDPASRSCLAGPELAFPTIAAASAAALPGSTIVIRGGVYAEQLRPLVSGLAGLPITYRAFDGESVKVGGGVTGNPGILLSDLSYIVIEGIRVEDRAWCEARNTHHCELRNCVFLRTPASGTTGNVRFITSTYNKIVGCQMITGNDNLLLIDSDRNLVEGNTIGDGRHSVLGIRCGDYNMIRGNYLYNTLQKIAEVYDCGVDTTAVANSFDSTRHNIFEENIFDGAVIGPAHDSTSNGNGIQWSGQDGIARRNFFMRCNVGIGLQVYSDEALHDENSRFYNNVFFQNNGPGLATHQANVGNILKNNIFFQNAGCIGGCTAGVSAGQIVYRSPTATAPLGNGTVMVNNDIIYQTPGQLTMELDSGSEGSASGITVSQFNSRYPGILTNTFEVDPQFENPTTNNFRLRPGSPLIDAGAFLTRATSSGHGAILTVADPFYFYDGFGIEGEAGDIIQLEGQTNTARILSVDYPARTLTLDQALTWEDDQGVALQFNGQAPDIGAFEAAAPEVRLSYSLDGQSFQLVWTADANYELVTSTNVTGPYNLISSSNGIYAATVSGEAGFFQLHRKN
jgi:hypothetical protein